ncbi:hypothetical protein PYCCODRAFT_265269 [Trametes coccinea BRFM310]|uniref:Uncharacterized protein n=1 Tax=Trametes coccinea (strain BRFM310) TaxID=1353009 RepID=A0A1Y2IQG8_TRAC3|nr:hypothetical protein PYCCODRAFT_265269 [Trametes coccinea BRFM310]
MMHCMMDDDDCNHTRESERGQLAPRQQLGSSGARCRRPFRNSRTAEAGPSARPPSHAFPSVCVPTFLYSCALLPRLPSRPERVKIPTMTRTRAAGAGREAGASGWVWPAAGELSYDNKRSVEALAGWQLLWISISRGPDPESMCFHFLPCASARARGANRKTQKIEFWRVFAAGDDAATASCEPRPPAPARLASAPQRLINANTLSSTLCYQLMWPPTARARQCHSDNHTPRPAMYCTYVQYALMHSSY